MIEFFFDCSSPWTYLGFHNIQPLAASMKVPITWRPILVGGVFNAVNPSVYASREKPVPAKRDYMLKDLQDWARHSGLKIVMPPKVFPVNSVKAMRGCIWLDDALRIGSDVDLRLAPEQRADSAGGEFIWLLRADLTGAATRTSRKTPCWPASASAAASSPKPSSPPSRATRSRRN